MTHSIKSLTTTAVSQGSALRIDFYLGDQIPDSEEINEGLACSVLVDITDNPSFEEIRCRAINRAYVMLSDYMERVEQDELANAQPTAH